MASKQRPDTALAASLESSGRSCAQTGTSGAWLFPEARHDLIADEYDVGGKLGSGITSVVRKCTHKTTKKAYALKIMDKKEFRKIAQVEVSVMMHLSHPNMIQLHEVFENDRHVFLVLDLVTGGELFDRIFARGFYTEHDAANVVRQVLSAVEYFHSSGVLHRDLKPENLLYADANDDMSLKVADFGLSRIIPLTQTANLTICGTPGYVAPEVLLGKKYGPPVDMWSIGVITYILLCGFEPFYDEDQQEIYQKTIRQEYSFPSPYWDDVSADAKHFIHQLLRHRPSKRMTASEALRHPWMTNSTPDRQHLRSAHGKLREKAKARGHWKQAILGTIAIGRLQRSIAITSPKTNRSCQAVCPSSGKTASAKEQTPCQEQDLGTAL